MLSHLNILVPAHDTRYDYFLPCALVHAPESDTDSSYTSNNFLITFDEGFVPKGIFSGLLKSLFKEGWKITDYYNADGKPQLFRKKAVLSVEVEGLEYSIDCTIASSPTVFEVGIENHIEHIDIVYPSIKLLFRGVCKMHGALVLIASIEIVEILIHI